MSQNSGDSVEAKVANTLRASGSVFAEEEAQLLINEAKTEVELSRMISERTKGTPMEQIIGWAEFFGNRIVVEPKVFIPRYKTEFLVAQALALCGTNSIVLDLCCGTGALGLAMKTAIPSIQLFASDVDPTAVRCARHNLSPLGANVFEGDLYDPIPQELKGKIDVILANAPYVPTEAINLMPREARLYENRTSLDGGIDGLEIHRRIATSAIKWLAPGGYLLIETSKEQSLIAFDFFSENGLETRVEHSEDFEASVVIGRRL